MLAYAAIAFERLERAGGSFIGLGSSDARRIPEGWPKAKADEQFIALLTAMGPLAARHRITVSVESQRREEVNYLTRIAEVVAVVAAVDHPNIRVLADFYHMAVMGDSPADIEKAGPWVGLTEIAERDRRTVPGVAGDDFRPAFAALARAGYRGPITIEGNGTPDELRRAFTIIDTQSREALAAARLAAERRESLPGDVHRHGDAHRHGGAVDRRRLVGPAADAGGNGLVELGPGRFEVEAADRPDLAHLAGRVDERFTDPDARRPGRAGAGRVVERGAREPPGRGEVLVDEPGALADQRLGLVDALASRSSRCRGSNDQGEQRRSQGRGDRAHGASS